MRVARIIYSSAICLGSFLLLLCCKKEDDLNPLGKKGNYYFSMEITGSGTYKYWYEKSFCDVSRCELGMETYGVEMSGIGIINKMVGSVGGRFPIWIDIGANCEPGSFASRSCIKAIFDIDTMTVGSHQGGVAIDYPESYTTTGGINQNGGQDPDLSLTYDITNVGPLGGLIQGTFIGTVYNLSGPVKTVTEIKGLFSVERGY
jgi:hypothetical protein